MATENEVKITRPIHGEAGPYTVDVGADGEVVLRGLTEAQIGHEFAVTFTAAQFATLGALATRVRKAQGSGKKQAAGEKAPRRKRRTRAEIEAARAAESVANGGMNGAAPAAGIGEPVL